MHTIRLFMFMACMAFCFSSAFAFAAEEGGGEAAPGAKPEFEYLQMKTLVLPIITEKGLTQQVSLVIAIELPFGSLDAVKPMEPKLADAYIRDLYGALGANGVMMKGNVVDVVAIKDRLSKDTATVLGQDKFHDVLLQVVQQSQR